MVEHDRSQKVNYTMLKFVFFIGNPAYDTYLSFSNYDTTLPCI